MRKASYTQKKSKKRKKNVEKKIKTKTLGWESRPPHTKKNNKRTKKIEDEPSPDAKRKSRHENG